MDPLDPLTEIINSGQAFSSSIALERILWVVMGFFLLGAISSSVIRKIKQNNFLEKKKPTILKAFKEKDNFPTNMSNEDK